MLGRLLPLLAAGYAAIALTDLLGGTGRPAAEVTVGVVGTLVLSASMVLAPRAPLAALLVAGGAVVVESAVHADVAISPAATLVSIVVVGRLADRRRAAAGLLVAIASVLAYYAFSPPSSPAELVSTLVAYTAFWALAYAWARRDEEAERARRADRALLLAELRTQMARDLHDIIGHTLNVVVVHAGAARLSLDGAPAVSRDLLLQIEHVGREAMADLDDAVATLRDPAAGTDRPLRPTTAGLADLPALVERFAASGVRASLVVDPALLTPDGAPSYAVAREAYRIVQESLTNALKHAAPCRAQVEVSTSGDHVVVTVRDDGAGPPEHWLPGRGLGGIRERATRVGGTARLGPVGAGAPGFRVEARLPLDRQPA
ncbi:sensor histidine kinase [Nocardioides humi]|uniref:sensor histidine kinase n=1 Tax=Nocardioides humi TaxID=449461 RepID=UPI0031DEB618